MDQPQSPDLTVLIVEPVEHNQRLFEVVLRSVANRRLVVDDPDAARAVLKRETVDLVIIEPQGTPSLDWSLLEELVADDIPTIVVTTRADNETLHEARRRGADAVLTKPFQPRRLREIIRVVLPAPKRAVVAPVPDGIGRIRGLSPKVLRRRAIEGVLNASSSAQAGHGRRWSAVHRGSIRQLLDRLRHKPTADPSPTDPVVFGQGRVQRAAVLWVIVAIASFGISLSFTTAVPFLTWLVFTGVAAGLTSWAALRSDRSAYDAALPVKVALGVAVGPLAAPLALCAQGVLVGLAKGASTKAKFNTTLINIGIFVLEGFTLGVALRFVLPHNRPIVDSGWLIVTVGLVTAIGLTLAVNHATVRATLRYLAGQDLPLQNDWGQHLKDVAGGTLLALVVMGSTDVGWLAAVTVIAAGGVITWRWREVRAAQHTAYLQLQAQVLNHERQHAALADHTQQVVALVEQLVADRPERERMPAIAGAWCHTLATGGWPDRCSGATKPELWDQVRHLPRGWQLDRVLESAGRPRHIPLANMEDLDAATLVGISCAVDALRLEDGQLQTTQDITDAWGHPKNAVDSVYDLRHA